MIPPPPTSTLFPYTTLFRSVPFKHQPHGTRPSYLPKIKHSQLNGHQQDRKSTRLNSSHGYISYAVFCLKKKKKINKDQTKKNTTTCRYRSDYTHVNLSLRSD